MLSAAGAKSQKPRQALDTPVEFLWIGCRGGADKVALAL
jgi:hypothetical protein